MRTKSKLSITIDNKILEEIEKTTKTHKFSKSQLTEEALKLWLKKHTEQLMAKGYKDMANEDQEFAKLSLKAQEEALHE
jgi:metal-responsive CopG/Arc/MetJ family transcriptional regulator